MQDLGQRYLLDEKYRDEINDLPSDRWFHDKSSLSDLFSYPLRVLARSMRDANYPISFGDIDGLNELGTELLHMRITSSLGHILLENCDEETKQWKTFRDIDPSPFRSLITGMGSVPLKGKWLEIDDEGNPVQGNKAPSESPSS
jgi:hypothetical protein